MIGFGTRIKASISGVKLAVGLLAFWIAPTAYAEGLSRSTGTAADLAAMQPGDQLVLSSQNIMIDFAGRQIRLSDFSGIVGYASDVAYVVTISGSASSEKQKAIQGRMLILPPFGAAASVARFDAQRLSDSWQAREKTEFPGEYAALQSIAKSQSRGIFFGSLGRTNFNVAASGLASEELARRSIVGSNPIQNIRFSAMADRAAYEKAVVSRFVQALVSGDPDAAAELMDPLPFGLTDMRGEPGDARTMAAQRLVYERNWAAALGDGAAEYDPATGAWTIAGPSPVIITLRNSQDIPFIKSIRIGG